MSGRRIPWESIPARPLRNEVDNSETSSNNGVLVDVNRLIHLTEGHPVTKRPLADFEYRLDRDCWTDRNKQPFTPRSLIALIQELGYEKVSEIHPEYQEHIKRIQEADYRQPIHVQGDWLINGMHRVVQLMLKNGDGSINQDFVTVKELKTIPQEAIKQTDYTFTPPTPEAKNQM